MTDPESIDEDWTHRLVVLPHETDRDTDAGTTYNDRLVRAENALLDVLLTYGSEIHLLVWADELAERAPRVLQAIDRDFERVSESERRWSSEYGTEYRFDLEEATLDIDCVFGERTDDGQSRRYDFKQILVRSGDEWLYYSVPDEIHERYVNLGALGAGDSTTDVERVESVLEEALSSIPGTYLFSRADAVSWETDGDRYAIQPGRGAIDLRVSREDGNDRVYDLARVEAVTVDRSNDVLGLRWRRPKASASLGQLSERIGRHPGPPVRVQFADGETFESVTDALRRLSSRCGYDVRIS